MLANIVTGKRKLLPALLGILCKIMCLKNFLLVQNKAENRKEKKQKLHKKNFFNKIPAKERYPNMFPFNLFLILEKNIFFKSISSFNKMILSPNNLY